MVFKRNIVIPLMILSIYCSVQTSMAIFATNLFWPFDINLRPPRWECEPVQLTGWVEAGVKSIGFDPHGHEVNIMQIWNPTQDGIAMLKGFPADSAITKFLNSLGNPDDNGIDGHFRVTGDIKPIVVGFAGRYHFPYDVTLGIYVPVYSMKFNHVKFQDLTQNVLIKDEFSSKFFEVVKGLDPSLNLQGWHKTGLGDIFIGADWLRTFPQGKPILRDVTLNVRAAFNLPTGVKKNEDDILFIPFGFDGSVGLVFGGGIVLNWLDLFRGGLDIEFIELFGNTRMRRIKVQEDQTDFLFLAKTEAHKDFGFTQRFNLFFEAYRFFHGLSLRMTYQFWQKGDDKLALCSNEFSNTIANTAESLQEWTMHQLIVALNYDFQTDLSCDAPLKPQLSLFYKFPFNGSRALMFYTVGGTVSFSF